MRKIIYNDGIGGILVLVHPAISMNDPVGFTEADAEARAFKALPSNAVDPHFIEPCAVPVDRTYRNAWKAGAVRGTIEHDIEKCRELHKNILREARRLKFPALDIAYLRADEAGEAGEKQRIAKLKQAYRDVTADPRIAAATTTDDLKAIGLPE